MRSGSEHVTREIRALEGQLARAAVKSPVAAVPVGTPEVAQAFTSLPLAHRREIIRALCEVTLSRSRKGIRYVDLATIEITWLTPDE